VDEFLANEAKGTKILGAHSLEEMVLKLKKPRRVMLMVKAGKPVDEFIDQLLGVLERATSSLMVQLPLRGHHPSHQVCGIQGFALYRHRCVRWRGGRPARTEHHAGGSPAAWPHVKPIFQAIAAKVGDGTPCCDWVGEVERAIT